MSTPDQLRSAGQQDGALRDEAEREAQQAMTDQVRSHGLARAVATRQPHAPAPPTTRQPPIAEIRHAREMRVWNALVQPLRRDAERRAFARSARLTATEPAAARPTASEIPSQLDDAAPTARDDSSTAPAPDANRPRFDSRGRRRRTAGAKRNPSTASPGPSAAAATRYAHSDIASRTSFFPDHWGGPRIVPAGLGPEAGTSFRAPEGTVPELYVAEPGPPEVLYAYSDIATRTTFTNAGDGEFVEVPADTVRKYSQVRPLVIPLEVAGTGVAGTLHLPFATPRRHLPGEPEAGLFGKVLPYPPRGYGRRPQAQRLHTCVACSYGKFDAHERNFALCKDCHRSIGPIPNDLYHLMVERLQERGLVERQAESLAPAAGFGDVARALIDLDRKRELVFGISAGQPFEVYPQTDLATRRTLLAGPDGRPQTVPAHEALNRPLHPIRGRYPTRLWAEGVDLASALGDGLALSEDNLMLHGERSARTDESPFQFEEHNGRDGRRPGAAALSDFTDQRPIEFQKGSGLTREEIFALSDAIDRKRSRGGIRRIVGGADSATAGRSRRTSLAPRHDRAPADSRHLRGHADPLFFTGPRDEWLSRHAIAGTHGLAQREALRHAVFDRDWDEALHDDAAWNRRWEAAEIRRQIARGWREPDDQEPPRPWRAHTKRSGPFPAITPPLLAGGYTGPTGVDEELGRHDHSKFLSLHRASLDGWLGARHLERVTEWLHSQGISGNAARIAADLLEGKESDVVQWLEGRGIPRARYDAVRDWIDESNPRSFHRAYQLNPNPRDIGDLTPPTPIKDRLARTAAEREAEAENWRAHGGALTPLEQAAVVAEFRAATAAPSEGVLPPTSGMVAVERGTAEAPGEFADARARLQTARQAWHQGLEGVFADPKAFAYLFASEPAAGRRQILETLRVTPAALEARLGPAARLKASRVEGARGGDIVIAPGVSAQSGARTAAASNRARMAAREGHGYLDARRDFRRALRAISASTVDGDALHEARIEFRTATSRVFADPGAFHRVFNTLPTTEKRAILAVMAERPEELSYRLLSAGRLATPSTDPRWGPLAENSVKASAATAAEAGRTYVSRLTAATRALRSSLREARDSAREQMQKKIERLFPEAPAIDQHARLTAEIDRLDTEVTTRRSDLALLDRTHTGLVASAREFREQLSSVVRDPAAFVTRLRELPAAEKHRVFDLMASRPEDLVSVRALGEAGRLQEGARRFAALVAVHGRHYVESTLRYRDQIAASAKRFDLPETASRSDVRSAVQREVEASKARQVPCATSAARSLNPILARPRRSGTPSATRSVPISRSPIPTLHG
jgi:hypothetical protein